MTSTRERASTLLFFPAALLVMVVLAAITVDFARLHLAQRQADDLAAAIANDAATLGLDEAALRAGRGYRLLPARVQAVASARAEATRDLPAVRILTAVPDHRSVEVNVSARLPLTFARILPHAPDEVFLRARATASARLR